MTIAARRLGLADDPILLDPGSIACCMCGIGVSEPTSTFEATPIGVAGQPGESPGSAPRRLPTFVFTRCPECQARHDLAVHLVDRFGRIAASLGPDSAAHKIELGLIGLAVLGHERAVPTDEGGCWRLLRHLVLAGGACRFQNRYVPVIMPGARPGMCSPSPWSHVRHAEREAASTAFGRILAERKAISLPPVQIQIPTPVLAGTDVPLPGGCLSCGLASTLVPASEVAVLGGPRAAQQRWRPLSADPTSLGGPAAPSRLSGHLCPVCASVLDRVGAVGQRFLRASLAAHGHPDLAERLMLDDVEITGWGGAVYSAMRRGRTVPRANRTPWEHAL